MSCLPYGTRRTHGHLLKWALKLCFTVCSLALITTLYLHPNWVFITKESFQWSEISPPIKENNSKWKTNKPNNITRNIPTVLQHENVKKRRLPQAIIFGVKKCGTSALMSMIGLHPQVVYAKKELHFFNKDKFTGSDDSKYQKGLEWYRSMMPQSYEDQITMEKTPQFISIDAPKRIYEMNSSIKLILIVKDPTPRVVSDYLHEKAARARGLRTDWILKPFEEEILKPNGEVDTWHSFIKHSLYALHMPRWLQIFKREQIFIVDGDKLISDPFSEITKVEKFLNLPPYVKSDHFFWSPSKGFYCMRKQKKEVCLGKGKGRKHPQIDPKVMSKLRRFFAPLNEEFYKIVGHNFSWPAH